MLTKWIKHVIDDLINMIYSDNNDKHHETESIKCAFQLLQASEKI